MFGFNQKVLRVDLSTGEVGADTHDELFYRRYWGGACMGLDYLLKEMKPGTDALGPENLLCLSAGIAGVPVSGFNRISIQAKSPLTDGLIDSQAAGFFGPELRSAGWDGVVIKGRAGHPVYLWVHDGQVEIRDARTLWGLSTGESQAAIRDELGEPKARMLLIGPAGENLVRFACVVNDLNHVNGRGGAGAIFGSKNLKGVVVRGTGRLAFSDPAAIKVINKWFTNHLGDSPDGASLKAIGTSYYVNGCNEGGILPTHNFTSGWTEDADKISGETMRATIMTGHETCWRCAVGCKPVVSTGAPYHVDPTYGGPEYETIGAFGSNLDIFDPAAVAKANELCNKYGLDTISTGLTIAWAMECAEKGLLTRGDLGGIDLRFGNAPAMLEMVNAIALRKGFGDLLAEGSARASAALGKESAGLTLVSKKQEVPLHEPRGKTILALSYSISEIGADHLRCEHDSAFSPAAPEYFLRQAETVGLLEPLDPGRLDERKARMHYVLARVFSMLDALGICVFVAAPVRALPLGEIPKVLSAATGWEVSLHELMELGERRTVMGRCFIAREGFTSKEDTLPARFFEPLQAGPSAGLSLDKDNFEAMKRLYYQVCNWHPDTGIPTPGKLWQLELGWLAPEMQRITEETLAHSEV